MNHRHNSLSELWAWADVQRNAVQDSMPACSGWVHCLPNPHQADCGASAWDGAHIYLSVPVCTIYLFFCMYIWVEGKIWNVSLPPDMGKHLKKKNSLNMGAGNRDGRDSVRKEEPVSPIYPKTFGHIGEQFSITGHCTPICKHNVESPTMQERLSTGD